MKFFIDTANLEEISEISSWGILDGVTTNPSLMAKEQIPAINHQQHYVTICDLVNGDVSAEVLSTDFEGMLEEGRMLAALHPQIVVKVPMTHAGLKAIQTFKKEGIRTNCTLVFSSVQALLAAKAGATFVSPFIGRLDDITNEGIDLIHDIRTIFDNYQLNTQILGASIRHPLHVNQCALAGADVCTLPFKIFNGLLQHPLTDIGLAKFMKDASTFT